MELAPPAHLLREFPASERAATTTYEARQAIHRVLHGADDRLLVVVGPCSIHDYDAAIDYATRLAALRRELAADLVVVMRVYFEKPRTTVGWKGLINDPHLDDSYRINEGLRLARRILLEVNELELPAGTEYLDMITPQYIADLIAWGAIGARTTESQVHRELASGLSCPVGFKNGTDGDVRIAVDAIKAASAPHHFLSVTKGGHSAIVHTAGNEDCHIILRGGKTPNYDAASVEATCQELAAAGLAARLMIDCSHANSQQGARAADRRRARRRRADRRRRRADHRRDDREPSQPGPAGPRSRQAAALRRVDHRRLHRLGRDRRRAAVACARRAGATRSGSRTRPDAAAGPDVAAEIELKLALDSAAARRAGDLARHPAVVAVKRGRLRTARVASTYYDTPEFALEEARVALRVRRDGARIIQTVKGPPLDAAVGALHAHDEHEWRLAQTRPDPARLAETPWRKLFARAQKHGGLAPCSRPTSCGARYRSRFPTARPRPSRSTPARSARAARPRAACPSPKSRSKSVKGSAAQAYDLALALMDDWPLAVETTSKAARGYALVHGGRTAGARPRSRGLHCRRARRSRGGRATFDRAGMRPQIADNAAGLVADTDPEWVHQMRIGTRRLRSCLSLVAKIAGRACVAPVVAEVRWLAGVLGAARDWDVLAGETLPPLAAALAHDPSAAAGWKRLARSIGVHRRAARSAAREAVRSLRFQRLLLAIGALCARPAFGGDRGEPITAQVFADRLLEGRHRKLRKRGAALEHGTAEERHAVRVAAKKLRYAAEFFAPLDPSKRNRAYRKTLTRLQDALGHWHDAITATRLTAGLADKSDHATVGAVRGWVAAQLAALEPEIARAWQRFVATDRFWARG